MSGEVLERVEALARLADVKATIEARHRLAEREVAPRPRIRASEVPGEEPFGRPFAEPAQGDDPSADLVVVQLAQRTEVDVAAREPEHVLLFSPQKAEPRQTPPAERPRPPPRRELPRFAVAGS